MPAPRLSRYEFAPVEVDAEGRQFLDIPIPPSKVSLLRGASRVIAAEGSTLWTIAWAAYRSMKNQEQDIRPTSFFDVIAYANDIVDCLDPIEPGTVIFVPSIEVLLGEVRVSPLFYRRNAVT